MTAIQLLKSRIFSVERIAYTTAAGQALEKDVVRHPGSVAIVPVLNDGRICLIKNRRVTVDDTLIEIPAGTMEPPEPPLECAHRELIEETGYRAGNMELLSTFFPAPGILDEQMHLFLATDLVEGEHAREVDEQIENHVVTVAEAQTLIRNGSIRDAKTIIGILLLETSQPEQSSD